MDRENILNDFINLDFNRISKKQKSKARDYIINSLQELYKVEFHSEWYKIFKIIPFARCHNLESKNSDYEILLTAHYDTHRFRQSYIQAFINRKIQYSGPFVKTLHYLFIILFYFTLSVILVTYFKVCETFTIFLSLIISIIIFIGFPIFTTHRNLFNPAPVHDDNNSGVITLIHVAKILYERGYGDKIKLLFTDCEEKGLLGSQMFIKNNLDNLQDKIIINFDCVGRGSNLFITSKNNSELAKELQSLLSSKEIESTLYTKSYSDDKSFQKYNLNSIGLIRGDIDPKGIKLLHWTHTAHDTLNNINLDYITEIIQVITEFIESKI